VVKQLIFLFFFLPDPGLSSWEPGREGGTCVMSNEVIKIIEDTIRKIFERQERKRVGEFILELNKKLENTECVAIDLMFLGDDIGVAIECIKALNIFINMKDLRVANIEDMTQNILKNIRETIKERIKEMLRRPSPIRVFDI
jgi:hypothetical protein